MPKTIEIPSFDTLWKIGAVVGALILGYIEFTKELDLLRMEMDDANTQIEELVEKHIKAEDRRFEDMQEEIKWYQKNLSINPLSWKKKKK
jgi:hypothetical protein